MGRVLARAAGSVMIVAAAAGCQADTAGFGVEPPPTVEPTNPAQVTDLGVGDVATNSVTLSWTAVSDGNGGVAKYAVRFGSPTLTWANAYATEQVVTAAAVGERVSYTYSGLPSGTDHQFRLVSFRGTLNQDAIFGDYSNLASAQTEGGSGTEPPPSGTVASVTVSPGSYTFTQVGQTLQGSATARDASGNVVSAELAWTSTNPSVVSVDNMGLMTARASGSALIVVSSVCCGVSDTLSTQVESTQPPPSSGTALFTDDFESYSAGASLAGRGANGFTWGNPLYADVSGDIAHTGSRSLKFYYGPTEPNGSSHWWSEQGFSFGQNLREVWLEYYIYFPNGNEGFGSAAYRHESGSSSNNNKLMALWADTYQGEPLALFQLWSTGSPDYDSNVNVGRTEGGGSDSDLVLYPRTNNSGAYVDGAGDRGRWIQTRVHVRVADFGQSNGMFQIWKDGRLIIDVQNDPFYDTAGSNNYLRNGYLMGYDNGRFTRNTFIYIDSFKVFSQNPGW